MTNVDPKMEFFKKTGLNLDFEFATYNPNRLYENTGYNIHNTNANANVQWGKEDSTFLQKASNSQNANSNSQKNSQNTGFAFQGNDNNYNINNTGIMPWKPVNNGWSNTGDNSGSNPTNGNITVTGNNGYSYEIDSATGCITYKDSRGNKITVTEMRKNCPNMVESAIKQSKQIKAQIEKKQS